MEHGVVLVDYFSLYRCSLFSPIGNLATAIKYAERRRSAFSKFFERYKKTILLLPFISTIQSYSNETCKLYGFSNVLIIIPLFRRFKQVILHDTFFTVNYYYLWNLHSRRPFCRESILWPGSLRFLSYFWIGCCPKFCDCQSLWPPCSNGYYCCRRPYGTVSSTVWRWNSIVSRRNRHSDNNTDSLVDRRLAAGHRYYFPVRETERYWNTYN